MYFTVKLAAYLEAVGKTDSVLFGHQNMIAAYGKALEDDNISVMFRPFHEGTGSWFWWGRAFCDQESFKNLYKYTVEYLRDIKGVHNFMYVYGPSTEKAAQLSTIIINDYPSIKTK